MARRGWDGKAGSKKWALASVSEGAATRIRRQRDLIGAINLEVLFAQSMIRMFVMYFSIVRRSAACASLVRESASLITTTAHQ